jgi:hypothetical protein
MIDGYVGPNVSHLLLSGTPHFLHVVKILLDRRTVGIGFEDLHNGGVLVRAKERGPAVVFLDEHHTDNAADRSIRCQECFVDLGDCLVIQQDSHQDLQNVLGNVWTDRWHCPCGARQGNPRLVPFLLHRSERLRRGDPRSLCRSRDDRARFSRREGSMGFRSATSAKHLDQRGRLSFESMDAHAHRIVGLEPKSQATL